MRENPVDKKTEGSTGSTLPLYKGKDLGQALRTDHALHKGSGKEIDRKKKGILEKEGVAYQPSKIRNRG